MARKLFPMESVEKTLSRRTGRGEKKKGTRKVLRYCGALNGDFLHRDSKSRKKTCKGMWGRALRREKAGNFF